MSGFLNGAAAVINYVIDMGASVMLPIIIAILSVCIGVKAGKAIRSGLMIGVGFVGMGLIVDMMNANMGPAAQAMADRLGVSLSIVEVGWPGMSGVTWGSIIATVAIPLAIAVNLIMFALKLTKTVNIDIWNVWHIGFTGAIAYTVTGNFWIGVLGVVFHSAMTYKLGDLWAPLLEDYFGLESLTAPHGTSAYMAPVACLVDAVIDKIPGLNKIIILCRVFTRLHPPNTDLYWRAESADLHLCLFTLSPMDCFVCFSDFSDDSPVSQFYIFFNKNL